MILLNYTYFFSGKYLKIIFVVNKGQYTLYRQTSNKVKHVNAAARFALDILITLICVCIPAM